MKERTLILIKPDAMERGLAGEIITRFEKKGLKIVGMKMIKLDDEILNEHYSHLRDKPFFGEIVNYMKSTPIIAMVLEGEGAIEIVRKIVGATRPWEAEPGTIRGDMAIGLPGNLIHASDSPETAEVEIKRFFKEDEIFDWDRKLEYFFERH